MSALPHLSLLLFGGRIGGAWVIPLVFSAIGSLIVAWGMTFIRKDQSIRKWPRAPGQITHASVKSGHSHARDPNNPGWQQTYEVFLPEVRFVYTVEGRTFEGTQIARTVSWTTSVDEVQKRVDRYPVHGKVEVYVDPQDPAVAYLETPTSGGAVFLLIFGGFFLFVGVLLTVIFAIVM
ncbi:MAG: DUF3592 domain-containing protein [Byssovorax sp.]